MRRARRIARSHPLWRARPKRFTPCKKNFRRDWANGRAAEMLQCALALTPPEGTRQRPQTSPPGKAQAMTPERLQQIRQIYERAMEMAPARRDAYLADACSGDAELRREVDALVQTGEHAAA